MLFLGVALLLCACSPVHPRADAEQAALTARHARAARFDRAAGTSLYVWLDDHEPSRLDVARGSPDRAASLIPEAKVRAVGSDLRRACRAAKHDRALLLAFVANASAERALALDCGFALERDRTAVVVAPR